MDLHTWTLSLARLTGALFTGACLYIVLVEQPARLRGRTLEVVGQFRESVVRAERMQPTLLLATLASLGVALVLGGLTPRVWAAASLLALILPLSFALLVPINRRLRQGVVEDHRVEGVLMIERWGRLHTLRTLLAAAGTLLLWTA